jgi:hypothetical protein
VKSKLFRGFPENLFEAMGRVAVGVEGTTEFENEIDLLSGWRMAGQCKTPLYSTEEIGLAGFEAKGLTNGSKAAAMN